MMLRGIIDFWGCVALCSLPFLPQTRNCAGVLLLNTFFPARPADVSFHSYLLLLAWFFSTGTFGALVPESWILRFMAPECTSVTAWAYDSPYHGLPRSAKASIQRFAHIVPGIPDVVLRQQGTRIWRLCEGLLGPNNFTNVTAQAILAERNTAVRAWWSGGSTIRDNVPSHLEDMSSLRGALPTSESPVAGINEGKAKSVPDVVMILFGADDPLLPEFKAILENNATIAACIHPTPDTRGFEILSPESGRPSNEQQSRSVKDPRASASRLPFISNGWLEGGAGHYPMESPGAPRMIAEAIIELIHVVATTRRNRST